MSIRTFANALRDHDMTPHRDKRRVGFFNEMVTLASSYDEYQQVVECAGPRKKVIKKMLKKMSDSAITFEQWHYIHGKTLNNDPLHKTALNKMGHLASNPEEWEIVYEHSEPGSPLNEKAKYSKRRFVTE